MSQKIYTDLDIKGNTTIGSIANATTDTDKFLVSDNGLVKYRTGAEMLSDLGVAPGVASNIQHQVKAGVAINKGQAVYVTSADGTNMIVGLASNTSEATSSKTMGLLASTVAINGFANVITEGLLAGLNTIGATAGDPVWLGTDGNLIYGLINKPSAPAHLVFIGIVTRVNASNGEIFVKVQNGFEFNEIHDVDLKTTTPVNGDILGFNGTLWVNKTIAAWLGYTPANASGTNATGNWGISITGNAATATKLQTARTIGGVSFDGTANINLPGVNAAGNQSTTGNAATATTLQTARTINGTSFNGSANITTANWGTGRTITIGSTGKTVDGSGNVSWTLAEIGAQAAGSYAASSHTHPISQITNLQTTLDSKAPTTSQFVQSSRDFPLGTLISTTIDYSQTNGDSFLLELKGNTYSGGVPLDMKVQGYIYYDTIINTSGYTINSAFTYVRAMNIGGFLCFWIPTGGYWQGFDAFCSSTMGGGSINKVTTITNSAEPDGTKKVTINLTYAVLSNNTLLNNWNAAYNDKINSASLTASTLTLSQQDGTTITASVPTFNQSTTGNAATATTLQTARTLTIGNTGKTFDGSANVAWSLSEIGAQPAGSYAASSHTHDDRYYTEGEVNSLLSGKADVSHNHTSLTGVTSIGFAAQSSDSASISTTIDGTSTFFDFNLTDDNNNDWWRWRFTPSGSTVYDAMTLKPLSNGNADLTISGNVFADNLAISNWNTAYGWGNHASAGYLTSATLPAPLTSFSTSAWAGTGGYPGYSFAGGNSRFGFSSSGGTVDVYADGNFYATDNLYRVWHAGDFSSTNISNWNTAYGWGNHASAGYLKSSDLSNYVTTNTPQTITGHKEFQATDNIYYQTSLQVKGNGSTILPGIGFHQPGVVGNQLNMANDGWFQFVNGSNSDYANLRVKNISSNGMLTFGNNEGGVYGVMGDNDAYRIWGRAAGSNQGYLEISTADDGNEPIIVSQYTGQFINKIRQAVLLDESGNTSFPGAVSAGSIYTSDILGLNALKILTPGGGARVVKSGGLLASNSYADEPPSLGIMSRGKNYFHNQYNGQPTISIAIGDNDTGFNWEGDGVVSYYSNSSKLFNLNDVWHSGNFNPSGKVNAWENVYAVGFSSGDANLAPYVYHTTAGYRFLATQTWVDEKYSRAITSNTTGGLNNASDSNTNRSWFDYNWAGKGLPGSVINFTGFNGYSTELFSNYNGGDFIGVRTRNGDSGVWNAPRFMVHGNTRWGGNFSDSSSNLDSFTRSGFYGTGPSAVNSPGNHGYVNVINCTGWSESDLYQFQIASPFWGNDFYLRKKSGASWDSNWQPWYQIWHSGNFNPSSYQLAGNYVTVDTAGIVNYIPKFTSSGTIGNSQIFDNGTKVGIRTTTPSTTLDVNGWATFLGSSGNRLKIWDGTDNIPTISADNLLVLDSPTIQFYATDVTDLNNNSIYLKLKTITGNTTLDNTYHNKIVRITASCIITIPNNLRTDFNCTFEVIGAYIAQFVDGSGATTSAPFGRYLKTDLTAMFYCTGTASNYRLNGSLTTS